MTTPLLISLRRDGRTVFLPLSAVAAFKEGDEVDEFNACDANGEQLGTCEGYQLRQLAAEVTPAVPGVRAITLWRADGQLVFDRHPVVAWRVTGSQALPIVAGGLGTVWCLDLGEAVEEGRFAFPDKQWECDDPDQATARLVFELEALEADYEERVRAMGMAMN